jgi:hypothetical protein
MAFLNLSFETADGSGPGCADGWTFGANASGGTWAPFHTTIVPWEDFEREWNSNQNYLFAFGLLGTTKALYASLAPPKAYEDFEEFWNSNQLYVYGVAGTTALYNNGGPPQNFDSFEAGWVVGYLYAFVGVGSDLTAAAFDGTPEDFEDFEEDWDTNESYVFAFVGVGTDLTAAEYIDGNFFEDFDSADGWPICNTV